MCSPHVLANITAGQKVSLATVQNVGGVPVACSPTATYQNPPTTLSHWLFPWACMHVHLGTEITTYAHTDRPLVQPAQYLAHVSKKAGTEFPNYVLKSWEGHNLKKIEPPSGGEWASWSLSSCCLCLLLFEEMAGRGGHRIVPAWADGLALHCSNPKRHYLVEPKV